jgi:DNA replication protein DnaC
MTEYGKGVQEMIDSGRAVGLFYDMPESHKKRCQNCGGLNTVMVFEMPPGTKPYQSPHPTKKSKWLDIPGHEGWYVGAIREYPCPICSGNQAELRTRLFENSGRESDRSVTLGTFSTTGNKVGKLAARSEIGRLLGMGASANGFTTLWGGVGTGKSHLLISAINGFLGMNIRGIYAVMPEWIAHLKSLYDEPDGFRLTNSETQRLMDIPVLAIDELDPDKLNFTPWVKELVFRLIDHRYRNMRQVLTILGTNVQPKDYPEELGYLGSRMTEGMIVHVPAPDMRPVVGKSG